MEGEGPVVTVNGANYSCADQKEVRYIKIQNLIKLKIERYMKCIHFRFLYNIQLKGVSVGIHSSSGSSGLCKCDDYSMSTM